jgi:hypothetical protein
VLLQHVNIVETCVTLARHEGLSREITWRLLLRLRDQDRPTRSVLPDPQQHLGQVATNKLIELRRDRSAKALRDSGHDLSAR